MNLLLMIAGILLLLVIVVWALQVTKK